ncbi:MAG TPA: hypothetical protein PKN75_08895 [Bacteroidia bacterium]|nr:hypothetical protein [Bacteroidia bacterium]HNU33697.1 hypothetical protein [Bacteroidia bacterium]
MLRKFFSFLLVVFVSLANAPDVIAQFYQGAQMSFGKNRVQYNDFYWTYYRFKNFDTYFYVGGKEVAEYIGRYAQADIDEVEKIFDYRSNARFQFIIYNKLSDLKQTNIGLESADEQSYNIGGITRIVGNKILIYFNGDHALLHQQIRSGVAQVLFDQLMYGGNIKERLQASILLNFPEWYVKGLTSYIGRGWTTADDNLMRDGILSGRFSKFNRLMDNDAVFAGHSMWRYIADTYGKQSLSNLIYMTRINRSIESGFSYVLGVSLKELSVNWLNYYQKLYLNSDNGRIIISEKPLSVKLKPNRILREVKVSPDGSMVAYVSNDIGKYRIHIFDVKSGKSTRIAKGGYKSIQQENDLSVPLLAWHPSGRMLSYMNEKKGKVWFSLYTTEDKKTETTQFLYFEKILSYAYSDNGQQLVLSGVQKGQSDIYVYGVRSRQAKNVTADLYDDLYPQFVNGSSQIIFSSNRSNDTVGVEYRKNPMQNNLDLFLIDPEQRNIVTQRLTNTPNANEIYASQIDSMHYAYLADGNGIYNRYIVKLDSTISFIDTTEHYRYFATTLPQTNYTRSVLQHDVNYRKNYYAELFFNKGKYNISLRFLPKADLSFNTILKQETFKNASAIKTQTDSANKSTSSSDIIIKQENAEIKDTTKIDIGNYVFQSEFPSKKKKEEKPVETNPDSTVKVEIKEKNDDAVKVELKEKEEPVTENAKSDSVEFVLPTQRNYDLAFSTDYFISQLDNSLFNSTYQTYTGGAVYFDPGVNGLFKVGMSDLFNDHKIMGGFRFAGDFNSNEYLVSYEMLKRKIDRQFVFYRQSRLYSAGFDVLRVHTHDIKIIHKLPLNDLTAIKGTLDFRNDRIVFLSTDLQPLITPNFYNYWASAKVEYIFDNTISRGLNLYNGTRYKIFAETFKKFNEPKTDVYIVGADFRHYLKIHRQIIWANRFSLSTSFGQQKLLYYLGSEDNAIVPTDNFNTEISVDQKQNYAFQTLASPMRGFMQNIRNGNSFVLINSEIRFPVFQYIINRPIRSDFIRNFQIVGFGDVGTAWSGGSPFDAGNSLNTQVVNNGPVTVTITKQIQPVVSGYGFGLRSRLFGYFIRTDWAWGIDDKTVQDNIFYLSLGLDF